MSKPKILLGTWVYRIKQFRSGLLKKIKTRFCVRGDLQEDINVFDTYAPVASWKSIRMFTILALQKGWVISQIDFTNVFVHASMERNVYVSMPAMFNNENCIFSKEFCFKLNKSLYGLCEAPKLWYNFLEKSLE